MCGCIIFIHSPVCAFQYFAITNTPTMNKFVIRKGAFRGFLEAGLLGQTCICRFIRNCPREEGLCQFAFPPAVCKGGYLLPNSLTTCCHSFLNFADLTDKKCYLNVVLICVSLILRVFFMLLFLKSHIYICQLSISFPPFVYHVFGPLTFLSWFF